MINWSRLETQTQVQSTASNSMQTGTLLAATSLGIKNAALCGRFHGWRYKKMVAVINENYAKFERMMK